MNLYFAGPLFTLAERRLNEELSAEIRRLMPTAEIFFPQACDKQYQGVPEFGDRLFSRLIEAVDSCDAVVAILDGPDSDSGTCVEIGYARAKGKPVIGVRTDFRDGEIHGLNIMTAGVCSTIIRVHSTTGTIVEVAAKVVAALQVSVARPST